MRRDSRLSVALHVLIHMKGLDALVSSETLGPMLGINPVVLRRTMAGLREAGIVRAEKGHGGGWSLARRLEDVTLADVYEALGTPAPFGIGPREESPGCMVEQAINRALARALERAEALLVSEFRSISLADLSADVRGRGWPHPAPRTKHAKKGRRAHV